MPSGNWNGEKYAVRAISWSDTDWSGRPSTHTLPSANSSPPGGCRSITDAIWVIFSLSVRAAMVTAVVPTTEKRLE